MKLSDNLTALTINRISAFISQARSAGASANDEIRFTRHRAIDGSDNGWTIEIDFEPRTHSAREEEDN